MKKALELSSASIKIVNTGNGPMLSPLILVYTVNLNNTTIP